MSGQRFEPGTFRIQASGLFIDPSIAYTQTTPFPLQFIETPRWPASS